MANSVIAPTAGPILGQKIALAMVKAGMSSIPFASLAWDVIGAGLEFVNTEGSESFLDELAERVSQLELKDGKLGETAQAAAHEALQRLTFERSTDFARDLARAVAAVESSDENDRWVSQIAQVISQMSSRFVVYLGALDRFEREKPTEEEAALVSEVQPFPKGSFGPDDRYDVLHSIEFVLSRHYPSAGITSDLAAMQSLGLITVPSVRVISGEPEPWAQKPIRLTPLGQVVLSAFTDDSDKVPAYSDLA